MEMTKDVNEVIEGLKQGKRVRVTTGYNAPIDLHRVRVMEVLDGKKIRTLKDGTLAIEPSMAFEIYNAL